MVKETIQNGASKVRLVHALLISVVALAFWAGRISKQVDVNTGDIAGIAGDITFIRNYLTGWEPDYATQGKTQSKAQDQAQGSS